MNLPNLQSDSADEASDWVTTAQSLRKRQRRRDVVIAVLVFLIGFGFLWSGIEEQSYHADESRWINRAGYLEDLADPFGPTWNHQYLSRGQPPIGSYSIGLGLVLQGRDLETNPAYDFRRPAEWNSAYGTYPDDGDLMAARRWNAFLGAVSAAIIYVVVRQLSNPVGGIGAAVLLLANPLEIWYSRIALADTTLTLTLALLYLGTIAFMRKPRWWLTIAIGILIGFGGGNKFTPLALSVPLAGIGGLLLLRAWWYRLRNPEVTSTSFWRLPAFTDMSWMLISTPFVSLATFVVSYPYLWPDPINRTMYMLNFRRMEMDNQYRINPHFQTDSPWQSLQMTWDVLGNTWSSTLQVFRWLGMEQVGDVLSGTDLWLAIAGIALLTIVGIRKGLRSAELVIAALIVFQLATIILNMRVAFERYYLPIMFGEFVAAGVTIGYIASLFLPKPVPVRISPPKEAGE